MSFLLRNSGFQNKSV